MAELPAIAGKITRGAFQIDARTMPLADVEAAWNETVTQQLIVVAP
ncbi:hypothetical protein [Mycobacterium sp.]